MDLKKNLSQIKTYSKYLEPLGVVLFVAMLILPVLSAYNLSPVYRNEELPQNSVLGISNNSGEVKITYIPEKSHFTFSEDFQENESEIYHFDLKLRPRENGVYTKPFLNIDNGTSTPVFIQFSAVSEDTSSEIGVMIGNTNYILKDSKGNLYTHPLEIQPGENYINLRITNADKVNYAEEFRVIVSDGK